MNCTMLILWFIHLFLLTNFIHAQPPSCYRSSRYLIPQTPGDNGFRISIEGSFKTYVPGRTYKVTLSGFKSQFYQSSFKEFMLIAVPAMWSDDKPYRPVGQFELLPSTYVNDELTQEALVSQRNCPGGVTDANPEKAKTSITVNWIAPRQPQGCISFKATVVRSETVWFKDDNALTYTMCEDHMYMKKMMQPCCACGEAKYQVTFKALWSAETHKKDWPSSTAHFSTAVGAVHNSNYTLFDIGSYASRGLSELVLTGETHTLEQELANESFNGALRSLFFTRPIRLSSNEVSSAMNVMTVSPHHSKLSFASKMLPSPDWFTGINSVDLCLSNCTWLEQYSEDLYPLDAGIDSGTTYTSNRLPTLPLEKIRLITSSTSPTSSFHDPMSKPVMPVARVTIQRTLVRGTQCPNRQYSSQETNSLDNSQQDLPLFNVDLSKQSQRNERLKQKYDQTGKLIYAYEETFSPECRLAQWSTWSACSTTCGHGIRSRRRSYLMPDKAFRHHCSERTYDMISCHSSECSSSMRNNYHSNSINNTMCVVSTWSPWSHCSVTCGEGMRTRSRSMLKGAENAQCRLEYQLMEKESCIGMKPLCEQGRLTDMIEKKRICMQPIEIGSCSQYERRFYFNLDMSKCLEFEYSGCGANDNNFVTRESCEDTCDILLRGRTEDGKDTRCMTLPWSEWSACSAICGRGTQVRFRAYKVKFLAMGFCAEPLEEFRDCETVCDPSEMYRISDTRKTMIRNMEKAERKLKCMQPIEPGPCTKYIDRFYFDTTTRKCTKFQYGGCRGNENNFLTHDECEAMCDDLIQDDRSMVHDPRCLVSMWSEWSPCTNATCHQAGTQSRTRMYADKRGAMIARCSERLEESQQCRIDCNDNNSKTKQDKITMDILNTMHRPRHSCCACDEAKFQVTFHGLWSKQTHPRDWPPEHLLHWSDLIGAVHSKEYSLWNFGETASDGLKQVAEWGAIGTMQKEIKNHTKFGVIRNIMIVPGLWTVNVSKSTMGAFTTSKNHHFLSFVTMLGPSPDWIAGISGLDLCLPNCTWMDHYEELLHLTDAGTDMGVRYNGPKRPEQARKPIAPILSNNITDNRSPFYGSQPAPFAKISIKRVMAQGVACPHGRPQHSDTSAPIDFGPNFVDLSRTSQMESEKDISKNTVELIDEQPSDPRCMTSPWTEWTQCNVKCGNGLRTRSRMYKSVNHHGCNERLTESEMCYERSDSDCDDDNQQTAPCAVTDWSSFSPCSVTCGQGVTERRRWYIDEKSHQDQRCKDIHLTEKRQCQGADGSHCLQNESKDRCMMEPVEDNRCRGLQRYFYSKTSMSCVPFAGIGTCPDRTHAKNNFASKDECEMVCKSFIADKSGNDVSCLVSPWTQWGECSVTCGPNGFRRRSRTLLNQKRSTIKSSCQSVQLEEMQPCPFVRCPPSDCVASQWSAWSACTGCGQDAMETRTRFLVRRAQNGGKRCGPLKETRYCQTSVPC